MKKRVVALAMAVALSAPAFAEVTVYGKFIGDIESVKSDKVAAGAAGSLTRVVSNASRLGFKGEADLGDGLKAIYQVETNVNLTGEATNSGTSVSGGATATNVGVFNGVRNSNVGLKGDFGTIFLGAWDTPFKMTHNKIELFDNTTFGTATNLIGRSAGNFVNRQKNSLQYWSPNMSGFDVKLAYATDNAKTATIDKNVLSLSATYEDDMFYAALGHERHHDEAGAGLSNSDSRLVGAFKLGTDGLIGATVERLTDGAVGGNKKRNGMELMASYKFGANNVGASYARMGDVGGAANTGASQVSLRYGHNLAKSTELYAMGTALTNKTGAAYGFSQDAFPNAATGAKLTGLGVGIVQSF